VANRYSNQHILPLSQMSVTSECFYQPRANTDFDEEFEQLEQAGLQCGVQGFTQREYWDPPPLPLKVRKMVFKIVV